MKEKRFEAAGSEENSLLLVNGIPRIIRYQDAELMSKCVAFNALFIRRRVANRQGYQTAYAPAVCGESVHVRTLKQCQFCRAVLAGLIHY